MYISEERLRRKKREKRTGGGDEEFDRVEEKILGEKKRKRGGERERERGKKSETERRWTSVKTRSLVVCRGRPKKRRRSNVWNCRCTVSLVI